MPTRDAYAIGVLALLIFLVAFNLQSGWVYAVDALLVGILVVGFLSARFAVWRIALARMLPREAGEGERIRVGLHLRATSGGRRAFIRILDGIPGLTPASVILAGVDPGQGTQTSYFTTALRRGVHRAGPAVVCSGGLTGLFEARRTVPASGEITVCPRYWALSRFPLAAWTPALQAVGAARRRGGLEFFGLRDYRAGDSVRHVHWRSSARRGRLVIREFEQEIPGSVTLLIDTRPEVQRGRDAESTLEDLIRAAASIAWYVTARGGSVRLLASTPSTDLNVSGGWHALLRVLAGLQGEGRKSPLEVLAAAPIPSDQTVIVLSPDAQTFAALEAAGLSVAGVLVDPESYGGDHGGEVRAQPDGPSPAPAAGRSPVCVIRRGDDIGRRLEEGGR
jgi:uncharacterized protein (DUF58 family)